MSYNTGNPVPSRDPRDLVDNAENLDRAVNGDEPTWTDRLGRERKSWRGMENDFSDFLTNSGYQLIGDYAPGIEITAYNQIVRDSDGEFWRLSGQIELPYVTTGAGLPEGEAFVAVGDAALRQELASPAGAAMIGRGVVAVDSIADLLALPEEQRREDLRYLVKEYHAGTGIGGGEFYWDATSTEDENGITVFGESQNGRWMRRYAGKEIHTEWAGTYDYSAVLAAKTEAERVGGSIYINNGTYAMGAGQLEFNTPMKIQGESRSGVILQYSGLSGPAISIANVSSVNGFHMENLTMNGQLTAGSIGLNIGKGEGTGLVDSKFTNIRIFNFDIGIRAQRSWQNLFTAIRVQACNQPLYLGSQCNATTFDVCSFVTFNTTCRIVNCEGILFNSVNLSNFSTSASGFLLSQSNVVFNNPYFENPSSVIGQVGSSGLTIPSSLIISGGISNPSSFNWGTSGDSIIIDGLRISSGTGGMLLDNNGHPTRPLSHVQYRPHAIDKSRSNRVRKVFEHDGKTYRPFSGAYGGSSRVFRQFRDYLEIEQTAPLNGITVYDGLEVGKQYTMVASIRKDEQTNLLSNITQSLVITGVPLTTEDFVTLCYPFVAGGGTLRFMFQGIIQIRYLAIFEGVPDSGSFDIDKALDGKTWTVNAAPTEGAWIRGDIAYRRLPAAGGSLGWVCVEDGSPGVWKPFGSIEA